MEGQYVLKFQNVEEGATVSMVPSVRRQTIRTIEQWTSAYNTFVAIYTELNQRNEREGDMPCKKYGA